MTGPGLTLTGNETLAELEEALEYWRCERDWIEGKNPLRHKAISEQVNAICDAIIDKRTAH